MSTDFTIFYRHFIAHEINANYYSIGDLNDVIKKYDNLMYEHDDITGRKREMMLEKDHVKFYEIIKDLIMIKRRIIQ